MEYMYFFLFHNKLLSVETLYRYILYRTGTIVTGTSTTVIYTWHSTAMLFIQKLNICFI